MVLPRYAQQRVLTDQTITEKDIISIFLISFSTWHQRCTIKAIFVRKIKRFGQTRSLCEHTGCFMRRRVTYGWALLVGLTQMPLPKASGVRVCIGLSGAFFTFGGRKWRKCNKWRFSALSAAQSIAQLDRGQVDDLLRRANIPIHGDRFIRMHRSSRGACWIIATPFNSVTTLLFLTARQRVIVSLIYARQSWTSIISSAINSNPPRSAQLDFAFTLHLNQTADEIFADHKNKSGKWTMFLASCQHTLF